MAESTGKATVVTGDDQRIDIELRALTIICHPGNVHIKDVVASDGGPEIAEISSEHTLYAVANMHASTYRFWLSIDWVTKSWHHIIGSEGKHPVMIPPTIEEMRRTSQAGRHVFGMLTRIAEVLVAGKRPHLLYPESFLHPSQQVALTDVLLKLAKGGSDAKA